MTGLARAIEALLFLSPEPLPLPVLAELAEVEVPAVEGALAELRLRHGPYGGLEVAEVGGGVALRTRDDLVEVCDRLRRRPPEDRLSPAAVETLAVVAYLEPVSRPDIGRLRGVAVDSTVANLVERGLLEEAGRGTGGAIRYRTTRAFQERFGLGSSRDLPPLERFELTGPQADELRRRLAEAGHLGPTGPTGVVPAEAEPEDDEGGGDQEVVAGDESGRPGGDG